MNILNIIETEGLQIKKVGTERTLVQKKKFGELFGRRFRKENVGGTVYFYGVHVDDPGATA